MKKITLVKDKDKVIVDIDDRLHFDDVLLMLAEFVKQLRKLYILKT